VHFVFPAARDHEPAHGCSISGPFFTLRLTRRPSPHWIATLPSFRAWQAATSSGEFRTEFESALDQIDGLQEHGCLSSTESARLVEAMTESMPESGPLYDRYGIGISRGFVDLRPGTRTRRSMNAVTQRLGAETNTDCPANVSPQEVRCIALQGSVTVTVQFGVVVGGNRLFVEPGDSLESVLETSHQPACLRNLRRLRFAREFLDGYALVAFDPSSRSILHLLLFPGDHISCAQ
jgi:hypothetical protein